MIEAAIQPGHTDAEISLERVGMGAAGVIQRCVDGRPSEGGVARAVGVSYMQMCLCCARLM